MFNFTKTLSLTMGTLLRPDATWQAYRDRGYHLKDTAVLLTVPLILASAVLTAILGWVFRGYYDMGTMGAGFISVPRQLLLGLVIGALVVFLLTWIINFYAGIFKGRVSFNGAFAAVSFSLVPAFVGNIAYTLPRIGGLLSLLLFIYALLLLYKAIPVFLDVPADQRTLHYVASVLTMVVIGIVIGVSFRGTII